MQPCAGRGGNTWTSPPGCLMFSLLTRLDIEGASASLHFRCHWFVGRWSHPKLVCAAFRQDAQFAVPTSRGHTALYGWRGKMAICTGRRHTADSHKALEHSCRAGTRLPFIQYLISLALVEAIEAEAAPLLSDDASAGDTPLFHACIVCLILAVLV